MEKVSLISKSLSQFNSNQPKAPSLADFSSIVYGAWRINDVKGGNEPKKVLELIRTCLEHGITTFDHADIYGEYTCEKLFGDALDGSGISRDSIQLISKCGIKLVCDARPQHTVKSYDTSAKHITWSVENSLKQLKTDYLDLLLVHRPNPMMSLEDTARGLESIVKDGKVKAVGVSNFSTWQFEQLQEALPFKLATNQLEISLMQLDAFHDGTLGQCQLAGIRPMAWSPLAGGALFKSDLSQEMADKMDFLGKELQERFDLARPASRDQVALAFLQSHPSGILPIIGTQNPDRIKSAAESVSLTLDEEQLHGLWSAAMGRPVP